MKENRSLKYSNLRKVFLYIIFVLSAFILFNGKKAYASDVDYTTAVNIGKTYVGSATHYYISNQPYDCYYAVYGSDLFYSSVGPYDNTYITSPGAFTIVYYQIVDGVSNVLSTANNLANSTCNIAKGDIVFTTHDICNYTYGTTNYGTTVVYPKTVVVIDLDDYIYEFSSSVSNVTNLSIKKHSLYELGHLVIGESKTKLDISWDIPSDDYVFEIMVKSALNERERIWRYQTYKYHYLDIPIASLSGGYTFDITALGRQCLKNVWSDVNTGSWLSLPVTEIYYRYVDLDASVGKAYYGNWTKLDIISGTVGYEEAKRNIVTTTETIDPVTNDVVINDTVVDGTTTDYINSQGNEINENESLEYGLFEMQDGLDDASNTIKNVGSWLGDLPIFIGSLFAFLPTEILAFISLGIIVVVVLRVAGR